MAARYAARMDAHAINACAARVERGDPDRFLAAMAAPLPARGPLFVLYAFNLEVARAPWVTAEPLIAQMRLQFWREVIALEDPRAHDVAAPLQAMIRAGLPVAALSRMIDAREVEIGTKAPFADEAVLWAYLENTSGALMQASVQALGGADTAAARDLGTAQGLANYLLAIPALQTAGRQPLADGRPAAVAALAQAGLARLDQAAPGLRDLPRAALLAGWRARPLLRQAAREPGRVGEGTLGQAEFARRGGLLWKTIRGYR